MTMFDTLTITCPKCLGNSEHQSKAGPCRLENYTLATAPLSLIADINEEGQRGELYCEKCHSQF